MDRELNEYKQYIRKFPTYNVLEYFSKESMDIYKNYKIGIKMENVPLYNKKTGMKIGEHRFDITQWNLLEVSFNSIKYGNDYRSFLMNRNEFYTLLNKTRIISEKLEDISSFSDGDIFKHLICISNMEFDFEIANIQSKFNRLYHIMNTINNNSKYNQTKEVNYINFSEKFKNITGIDYIKYIRCYMLIVLLSATRVNTNIMDLIDDIKFDVDKLGFTKEDIKNIIKNQSKDYFFYRQYNNWNILKYNPIVHCDKNHDKYIISNISALTISFSEFMYWTIRNYYCELNSLNFTNYFGHCFEYYLNDFFDEYNITYEKLDENNDKIPDWKIETDNYIFLIEQKSALYPLDTRDITAKRRIKILDKYLKDNIEKAFIQLNNYNTCSDKIVIKICLTFEQIYFTETVQEIVLPKIKSIKDDDYLNWVVPINDFEKLFIILSKNKKEFDKIIQNKIKLEKEKYNNGRGFDTILGKYKNDYVLNKINYFKQITDDMKRILKDL